MSAIRVVSYNIHKGMSPLNRLPILDGLARALSSLSPDVLCLQEVQGEHFYRAKRHNYHSDHQAKWFGEYLALSHAYGKNAQYPHGHHGNATLSAHRLDPRHNLDISVNRLEQRGVLHSEIYPDGFGVPVVVLNVHLNLLHKDRVKQYQAISEYIDSQIDKDKPLILTGDFNDWTKKSSQFLAQLGLIEVFDEHLGAYPATFPAKLPLLSLDRMYVRGLAVKSACVYQGEPWSGLSDHLPIGAELLPANPK